MLKLKLQRFGHLMQRAESLEKSLMLGKIGGRRRKGAKDDDMVRWHHQLNRRESEQTLGRTGKSAMLQSVGPQRVGHDLGIEQQ